MRVQGRARVHANGDATGVVPEFGSHLLSPGLAVGVSLARHPHGVRPVHVGNTREASGRLVVKRTGRAKGAPPAGLEPATSSLEVTRSIRLSYGGPTENSSRRPD